MTDVVTPEPTEGSETPDTRQRILDAAESLFMAHGFEATTMRMITTTARANLAAVNYHFGSKESLIEEVFRRRLGLLTGRMVSRLDALELAAGAEPVRPSQIVEAFFGEALRAAADETQGGRVFMRLLGRTLTEPSEFVRGFLAREYSLAVERYKSALFRALPDVPREEIVWRLHFMLGATSHAISGADALNLLKEGSLAESNPQALYGRLMSFLLGGLRAPLPSKATPNATPNAKPSRKAGTVSKKPSGA